MPRSNASARFAWLVSLCLITTVTLAPTASYAATAQAIDAAADRTLMLFSLDFPSAKELTQKSLGILIFPEVIQGGVIVGGAYGEGVLRVDGKSFGYYSYTNGSFGFQLGAQRKSMLFLFLDSGALKEFQAKAQNSGQWQIGVDGSLVLIKSVGDLYANTALNAPVVGYIFDQAGLMFNASVGGGLVASIHRGAAEVEPVQAPVVAPVKAPLPSPECGVNHRIGPYCIDDERDRDRR